MSDDFPPFPPPNPGGPRPGPGDWSQQPPRDMRPPTPYAQGAEPLSEDDIGRTILFYRLYAGALLLVYALIGALVLVGAVATEEPDAIVQAAIIIPFLLAFSAFQAVSMWMPRKKWAWVSGMVILACGISSCCLPLALPLFLRWSKPGFKAAFEK